MGCSSRAVRTAMTTVVLALIGISPSAAASLTATHVVSKVTDGLTIYPISGASFRCRHADPRDVVLWVSSTRSRLPSRITQSTEANRHRVRCARTPRDASRRSMVISLT